MFPELDRVVRLISNVVDSYSTVLMAVDKGNLRILSYYSLGDTISSKRPVPLIKSGIYSVIMKSRKYHVIQNYDRSPDEFFFYPPSEEGIKSVAIVPVGERGILHVDSKRSYVFTDKMVKVLIGFTEIIEDLMDSIVLKMERDGLSLEFQILETCIKLSQVGDPGVVVKGITEVSHMDLGFYAYPAEGGAVYIGAMFPDKYMEDGPVPSNSVVHRVASSKRFFFIEMVRDLNDPIFWDDSVLNGRVLSVFCAPFRDGVIGFCTLRGGKGGNIKILTRPLAASLPAFMAYGAKFKGDPTTGFLMGAEFEDAVKDGNFGFLDVRIKNLADVYEALGARGGDEFLREVSEVLKKVVTSRITGEALFGRPFPHLFRAAIPEGLKVGGDAVRILSMAFENLAAFTRSISRGVKPDIEIEVL